MIYGYVRDRMPRVTLSLPGHDDEIDVEFIADTAFDGDLSLPPSVVDRLDKTFLNINLFGLADGSVQPRPRYEIFLTWNDELRRTEVVMFNGRPLLGSTLLEGCLLQAEMIDGGEVTIEPL